MSSAHSAAKRQPAPQQDPSDLLVRELTAVREIVRAFLTTDEPNEVYGFALQRVTPLVEATFASVFLTETGSDLMTLVAAYNWPERYRPWLGDMRVRIGSGPSGVAAAEQRAVEIPDVFADPQLADWLEVAEELGVRAMVALPLQTPDRVVGAVTFYFAHAGEFSDDQRHLLRIVADQMAATAEKAALIAELKRTNGALQESNLELEQQYVAVVEARRAQDEFLANISHELRTPLTAVIGYTQLLKEELAGPLTDEQRSELTLVEGASDKLLAIVDDLLELTSAHRGDLGIVLDSFDPRAPIRLALDRTPRPAPGVELRLPTDEVPLAPLRSDFRKVARILSGLIANACKFTDRGEITLTIEQSNDEVVYRVKDSGIGVPDTAREMIFEPFRQADGSLTRRHGGTGIGLALGRRLARLLGGDVTLVRTSRNAGSEFALTLPMTPPPEIERASTGASQKPNP